MNKQIEELYKNYQKKSDSLILETHRKLTSISNDQNVNTEERQAANDRLSAIQEVIQERGLKVRVEKKSNVDFDTYINEGVKSFVIGLMISIISIALMYKFDKHIILLIALLFGGTKLIQGIIELGMGLFVRVYYADRF